MDDVKSLKKEFEISLRQTDVESLILHLKKENEILKEKIHNLETLLTQKHRISTEELICLEQIEILRAFSLKRELTLEEVKKLDILIKNLRLLREQSTQVIDISEGLSDEELIKIATNKSE